LLAQSELERRSYRSSLQQFRILLRQDRGNFAAAFGEARIAYYQDHLTRAETLGRALVNERPQNFDAVMLLPLIERARRHKREALDLLSRADRIKPNDPEVRRLRERIREESGVTVHTSASYAREIATSANAGTPQLSSENLRMSNFGSTFEAA